MVVLEQERTRLLEPETDGVAEGYQHYQKRITPSLEFRTPEIRLKWYDIAFASMPVAPELNAEARDFLLGEIASRRLGETGELGFVILHDCGDVVFLLVSTWRNSNELWETIYVKQRDNGDGFGPFEEAGLHKPDFCVWELGAVAHEAQAWSRYLNSARDLRDRDTYFFDMFSGMI